MELSDFDNEFSAAEVKDPSEIPEGRYRVKIEDILIDKNYEGIPVVRWKLTIVNGEYAGRTIPHSRNMSYPNNMKHLKGELVLVGLVVNKFSELPEKAKEVVGVGIEVSKKGKMLFFNKKIILSSEEKDLLAVEGLSGGSSEGDDIPF